MSDESAPLGQDFFKDRWRNPLRRLGKKVMPIFFAMMTVIAIFLSFFVGIPFLIYSKPTYLLMSVKVCVAVILATIAIITRNYIVLRQRVKFSPIRIRVRDLN